MKYLLLCFLFLIGCSFSENTADKCVLLPKSELFVYNAKVEVISGFYRGFKGYVRDIVGWSIDDNGCPQHLYKVWLPDVGLINIGRDKMIVIEQQ